MLPKKTTIYSRFFQYHSLFSHERVQQEVANVDYRKNMTLIGFASKGRHKEMMAIGSYAEERQGRAEVAFVVREDYQAQGIGNYLLETLERIAGANGYIGFIAHVLADNSSMIHLFRKRYPNMRISWSGGDAEILMDFDDTSVGMETWVQDGTRVSYN